MMKSNFKCLHSKIGFSFSLQTCSYFRENVTVFEWRIRSWASVWWKAWGNFTYCRTQNIFYQKSSNTSELNHEILFTKSNSVWIYTISPRVCYLFLWHCKQQNDLIFARNFKMKFTYFLSSLLKRMRWKMESKNRTLRFKSKTMAHRRHLRMKSQR